MGLIALFLVGGIVCGVGFFVATRPTYTPEEQKKFIEDYLKKA